MGWHSGKSAAGKAASIGRGDGTRSLDDGFAFTQMETPAVRKLMKFLPLVLVMWRQFRGRRRP